MIRRVLMVCLFVLISQEGITQELNVCMPTASGTFEKLGWKCLNIVPGLFNLASQVCGSETRLATAEEHWAAIQDGTLWETLAKQNGWSTEDSISLSDRIEGFLETQWTEGQRVTLSMIHTNRDRVLDPLGTLEGVARGVNGMAYSLLDGAVLTPSQGMLSITGWVPAPSEDRMADSYLAILTVVAPFARTATAARVCAQLSSAGAAVRATVAEVRATAREALPRPAPVLCAGAAGGGDFEVCFLYREGNHGRVPGRNGNGSSTHSQVRLPHAAEVRKLGEIEESIRSGGHLSGGADFNSARFGAIAERIRELRTYGPDLDPAMLRMLDRLFDDGFINEIQFRALATTGLHARGLYEVVERVMAKAVRTPQDVEFLDKALRAMSERAGCNPDVVRTLRARLNSELERPHLPPLDE